MINEGEWTFSALLHQLNSNPEAISVVSNICYRHKGQPVRTAAQDWIDDLDGIPFPAWDLFPKAPHYPIMTTRGCPFACRFCTPFGRRVRERSTANVLEEIFMLQRQYQPEFVWFFDETFGINQVRTYNMLDGFIELGFCNIPWFAHLRVSTASLELMTKMYQAGCRIVGMGIEVGSERVLKEKLVDIGKEKQLVQHGKHLGIQVQNNFIFGHPNETLRDMLKTIWLAAHLNASEPVFGIMTPYPGTEIYELARENKAGYRLKAKSWNDYSKHRGSAMDFTETGNLTVEVLRLLGHFYFFIRNGRVRDLFKFIVKYWMTAKYVLLTIRKRV